MHKRKGYDHDEGESDDDDELMPGCGVKIQPLRRMVWTERRVG